MSAMTTQTTAQHDGRMWERLWRMSGINFVIFAIIAYVIYGNPPKVGASTDTLVSFYDGDRTRILIATIIFALAVLNLTWFAAAITSTLRDAGRAGWGAAATAASAALAGVLFLLVTVAAALAYSIAGSGNDSLTSGLHDVAWVGSVLVSFPAAMLVMSGTFGLWRAGIISNAAFYVGVAVVILLVLRGTTLASEGFWAPDGAYSHYIAPIIGLLWVTVVSWLLGTLGPATVRASDRRAVPAS